MNDFIYVYDDAVSGEFCDKLIVELENGIKLAKNNELKGLLVNGAEESSAIHRDDIQLWDSCLSDDIRVEFRKLIAKHYARYCEMYPALKQISEDVVCDGGVKLQKTHAEGGFHVWHAEVGSDYGNIYRIVTWTLYLNDIEEGGETEFLYQHRRLPAKKASLCIFPAHFTHLHRGNPPYSGDKYIATGWVSMATEEVSEDRLLLQYAKST